MLSKEFLTNVQSLHNDTESGAAQIADKSLSILKKECLLVGIELNQHILQRAIQLLLNTHPMASIENYLYPIYVKLTKEINSTNFSEINAIEIIERVFAIQKIKMKRRENNTIETLFNYLKKKESILTFSHSSTINSAFLKLAKNGFDDKEIYILESRPLREGERTVQLYSEMGFKNLQFGVDFAVNEFSKQAELALFGADTIFPDGRVLNKIGSATIAKLFHSRSKEVVVAASPSKMSLKTLLFQDNLNNNILNISHHNPKEVTSIDNQNIDIWNKYFEIVRPDMITSLIMDDSILSSPIPDSLSVFLQKIEINELVQDLKINWVEDDPLKE